MENGSSISDTHPSIGLENDSLDGGQQKNTPHDIYWESAVPKQWQEVGYSGNNILHDLIKFHGVQFSTGLSIETSL